MSSHHWADSSPAHSKLKEHRSHAVEAHAFNPSTWEAETGGFLSEFQESQGYTEKPCLEKTKKQKKKKKQKKNIVLGRWFSG
jgi:hypothetical protein